MAVRSGANDVAHIHSYSMLSRVGTKIGAVTLKHDAQTGQAIHTDYVSRQSGVGAIGIMPVLSAPSCFTI